MGIGWRSGSGSGSAPALVIIVFISSLLFFLTCQAAVASGHHHHASSSSSSTTLKARKLMLLNISNSNDDMQTPTPPGAAVAAAGHSRYSTARMGPGDCSREDVVVHQSSANPLPNGIPAYAVRIANVCSTGGGCCAVSDVHVACGDFASTELVDPAKFRRLGFNDCIVNGGGRLDPSETVAFHYSNSFSYQLNVASVACQCGQ